MKSRLFCASYKTVLFAVSLSIAVVACTRMALSQGVAPPQTPNRIAVIDIKKILENHVRFKNSMDQLKQRFEAAGDELKTEQNRIMGMQRRLQELKPGTPDFVKTEEDIQRAKTEWQLKANKHKNEIRNSEAQILWNVYYEVKAETKRFCEYNGIGMVLQYNPEPIDSKNPQDVVRGISRPIVYNADELDITNYILQSLNPQPNSGGQAGRIGVPARN